MADTDGVQTLDELKDEVNLDTSDKDVDNEITGTSDSANDDIENLGDLDKSNKESKEDVVEPEPEWMKDGSHEPDDKEKKYTGTAIGKAKFKATLKERRKSEAEIDRLKAENEDLRKGVVNPINQPQRSDFEGHDDPEDAYQKATFDYMFEKRKAEQDTFEIQQAEQSRFEAQKKSIETAVNKHYDEVEKLAVSNKIDADVFKKSDLVVRTMMEGVFPESGDMMTDFFISKLGKGSPEVFFNLGVDKKRLAEFENILRNDETGNDAFVFLGKLSNKFSSPLRKSTANAPAPKTSGGEATKTIDALNAEVEKAMEDGDIQKALDLREKATKSGAKLNRL